MQISIVGQAYTLAQPGFIIALFSANSRYFLFGGNDGRVLGDYEGYSLPCWSDPGNDSQLD